MSAVRYVPQIVLDEALDVLGDLGAWLRLAHSCPKCEAPQGCSHRAGCSLGRIARLYHLLGSGDEQRRDDALAALRRDRGVLMSEEDRPPPSPHRSAVPPLGAFARDADQPTVQSGETPRWQ